METMHSRCAGLDVHKKDLTACCRIREPNGQVRTQTRTFATFTGTLLQLCDWLLEQRVTHVALESTGEYWKPVYNVLEGSFEILLVNPQHVKALEGRKTDVKDAEWLAELLEHGLLRPSFVPPLPQRELRELTRCRTNLVRERVNLVNRLQKTLESANIKLASVASDVVGVSGRAMLAALIHGTEDPVELAQLARGRLRSKDSALRQALLGRMRPHHRLILEELLRQVDSLDASIVRLDEAIGEYGAPFERAIAHAATASGIGRNLAETIISEIGADMKRFGSAERLCAWAGVAPGNHQSGGKRLRGRSRQGNAALKKALVQAASAATHTSSTYMGALYHRLAARRGKKRALLAVAHALLRALYFMLERDEDYHELGADYFDRRRPEQLAKYFVGRLERLGFAVVIAASAEPTAA